MRIGIEEAIEEIRNGRMIILVDDEDRENEGDLVIAADFVSPEAINFMAMYGRGLICLSLTGKRCDELGLNLMVSENNNSTKFGTAFTVSIEAKEGVTTGISAHDRARTIKVAIDPKSTASDLARPGHIFPLRARDGGVLVRAGQTEGSVDLCRLAGLTPAAVICEIMKDDGTMARMPDLEIFAREHKVKIVTIADLIAYRLKNETIVEESASANLPTLFGNFVIKGFKNLIDGQEAVALIKGDIDCEEPVLVRVHSQCLTGDVFGSLRCDCRSQLHCALKMIEEKGKGILLYMFQEGRGIGILNKIKAYDLQDHGYDTVEANIHLGFKDDLRDYGFGAQILRFLNVKRMSLLTNNPRKIKALSGYGIDVVDRVPIVCDIRPENIRYLETKEDKLGHKLNIRRTKK
ncbi:MAG: bifunctional 3,4-dihydroxy-2-butanone-4-phosphate synthase/GTP cyclohydrolase II [Calditerrivibrio sp.]|nr:bifunctional 3,4-dihydroxy-2-butanone-4-phosphate synthase/GTP cyclohydrolase II [Calditerrivibrio sp.]MCA1932155.1 bifunctional 3,4-dihydroxy-2-butanone-4-phosphate synthase/GTP cyclohydrolase II [Calditerrivibrio sp.]MCA1980136.1 bifunctional 3,4-dihydroxy-2-butanone-4-phosphate synthase/GTP cyclohydrolase II [Calditerrivibrio sp.]